MVAVKKSKGQSKDSIFRRFTKLVMEENIIEEVRDRLYHKTPSEIRKERNKERERGKRRRYHS